MRRPEARSGSLSAQFLHVLSTRLTLSNIGRVSESASERERKCRAIVDRVTKEEEIEREGKSRGTWVWKERNVVVGRGVPEDVLHIICYA